MWFRGLVSAALLVAWLPGCTGWQTLATTQPVPKQEQQRLRVTLLDGRRLELDKTSVVGDSLIGFTPGDGLTESGWVKRQPARTAVLLAEIVKMEDRQVSAGESLGGVFLAGLGGLAFLGLLKVMGFSPGPWR